MKRLHHILRVLLPIGVLTVLGCNLPAIPVDLDPPDQTDAGGDAEPLPQVCEAFSRVCLASSIRVCSPDGTDYDIRPCERGETCANGACIPIENTCSKGQPFGLSATELVFDVSVDNKAQTQIVTVDNCGTNTLFVEQIDVRGLELPDQTPIFSLDASTPPRARLAPGDHIDLRITYSPAPGVTQAEGTLDLGIITSEYGRYTIPLRTSSYCASATPRYRWQPSANDDGQGVVWFQNFGTEDLNVSAVTSSFDFEPLDKLPAVIAPGGHLGVDLALPPELGPFLGDVRFHVDEVDDVLTQVLGHRLAEDCVDAPQLAAFATVNNIPHALETLALEPGDLMRIGNNSPDGWMTLFELIDQPGGSHIVETSLGNQMALRPWVTGNYSAKITLVDEDHQPACITGLQTFEVVPPADRIYVELVWENIGDLILTDRDPGQGVNLDLHVLQSQSLADMPVWNAENDCAPATPVACTMAQAVSSSVTGESPEGVAVSAESGVIEIGAYVVNPFNFAGAGATMRVWDRGVLIERRERVLEYGNEFWLVGRLELDDSVFTGFDTVSAGFPR